jgi:hypothetical protein
VSTDSASKATGQKASPAGSPSGAATADEGELAADPWWDHMRTQLQALPEDVGASTEKPAGRRRHGALLLVALTGLGLIVGFAAGGRMATHVATAQVDAGPGSTLDQQLSVSADQANRYVQTQVLFLTDPATATAVQKQLSLNAPPAFTVRQVDTTSVLEISASNVDAAAAADVANSVARTYVDGWRARTSGEIDRQGVEISSQLAAVTTAIDALSGNRLTPADQAKITALTVQSQTLLAQQSTMRADAAAVASDNRMVTLADSKFATTTPSTKLTALMGGLLAFVVGVGIVAWSRRRS